VPHAIRVHKPGGPEVLQWDEVPAETPGAGMIRLRHQAVGVNYIDIYQRAGLYSIPMPFTLGMEGAGTVEAIGPGVTALQPGDRVAYAGALGGYTESRLIGADRVVKLPDSINSETAAAMMLQGMTVQYLIRQVYPVTRGDTILIHAAAGGVGLILCQWAASLGATVIGTVSTDEKANLAQAHGCHHPIVYTREDFATQVMSLTNGAKLPVVYDSIGKDTFAKSLDCLRPRGLLVSFGQASGPVPPFDLGILAQKGSLQLTRPTLQTFIATAQSLRTTAQDLFDVVTNGTVKIAVNHHYPLQHAAQAHIELESRKTTGSIILTV
jgi:NADPH:quinone reductase